MRKPVPSTLESALEGVHLLQVQVNVMVYSNAVAENAVCVSAPKHKEMRHQICFELGK